MGNAHDQAPLRMQSHSSNDLCDTGQTFTFSLFDAVRALSLRLSCGGPIRDGELCFGAGPARAEDVVPVGGRLTVVSRGRKLVMCIT